jgi:hypothetical protein
MFHFRSCNMPQPTHPPSSFQFHCPFNGTSLSKMFNKGPDKQHIKMLVCRDTRLIRLNSQVSGIDTTEEQKQQDKSLRQGSMLKVCRES